MESIVTMINNINLHSTLTRLLFAIVISTLLAACGGEGEDNETIIDNTSTDNTSETTNPTTISGILVIPASTKRTTAKLLLAHQQQTKQAKECENVPTGYLPLAAFVNFLDASGQVVTTATTDECGNFSVTTNNQITNIRATSSGNRDIFTDISVFQQTTVGVASAIPAPAQYQIASIQLSNSDQLAFAVTDTITNKAVIGIPSSALSVSINGTDITITNLQSAITATDAASVGLIMDASPSMASEVKDENDNTINDANDNPYTRFRLSALAAHTYLNNVSAGDETSMVIFDRNVDFINDSAVARLFTLGNANSTAANYTFSADGFTTEPASLRFIVDAYNPYSKLYTQSDIGYDEKHPDSPQLQIASYPWTGGTAIYDAIVEGLNRVTARTNPRKILIAMSDGGDNRSSETEQSVINDATAKGIPVYTIAYGEIPNTLLGEANVATMRNIATATNATFFLVDDLDLAAAFQSIQTGINFQYIAALSNTVAAGDSVALVLDYNGISTTRTLQQ